MRHVCIGCRARGFIPSCASVMRGKTRAPAKNAGAWGLFYFPARIFEAVMMGHTA